MVLGQRGPLLRLKAVFRVVIRRRLGLRVHDFSRMEVIDAIELINGQVDLVNEGFYIGYGINDGSFNVVMAGRSPCACFGFRQGFILAHLLSCRVLERLEASSSFQACGSLKSAGLLFC